MRRLALTLLLAVTVAPAKAAVRARCAYRAGGPHGAAVLHRPNGATVVHPYARAVMRPYGAQPAAG
jgi:hypothetical protein